MKKYLVLAAAFALVFSLCSCGSSQQEQSSPADSDSVSSSESQKTQKLPYWNRDPSEFALCVESILRENADPSYAMKSETLEIGGSKFHLYKGDAETGVALMYFGTEGKAPIIQITSSEGTRENLLLLSAAALYEAEETAAYASFDVPLEKVTELAAEGNPGYSDEASVGNLHYAIRFPSNDSFASTFSISPNDRNYADPSYQSFHNQESDTEGSKTEKLPMWERDEAEFLRSVADSIENQTLYDANLSTMEVLSDDGTSTYKIFVDGRATQTGFTFLTDNNTGMRDLWLLSADFEDQDNALAVIVAVSSVMCECDTEGNFQSLSKAYERYMQMLDNASSQDSFDEQIGATNYTTIVSTPQFFFVAGKAE